MLNKNGSILIVDDEIAEGKPLMDLLSKNNIPFVYQSGNGNTFPTQKYKGIRIIFLDLVLGKELESQSKKNQISKVVSVLQNLIDVNNGPYFIVAWTKHDELIPLLIDRLKESTLKGTMPINVLNLEKITFMQTNRGGGYEFKQTALEDIETQLNTKLLALGAFKLIMIWENAVKLASINTVNQLNTILSFDSAEWNKKIVSVFHSIARASGGQQIDITQTKDFSIQSLSTFTSILNDYIDKEISNADYRNLKFEDKELSINDELKSKINSSLLLSEQMLSGYPGNVYPLNNKINKEELLLDCLEKKIKDDIKTKITQSSFLIMVEFTPLCDYAQKKIGLHKLVPGFIVSKDYIKNLNNSPSIIKSPLIDYKKNQSYLVLNSKFIFSSSDDLSKLKPIMMLRKQFLVDLQSKIAQYINRPGLVAIDS